MRNKLPQMKEIQKSYTSFVTEIKPLFSVLWVSFEANTHKRTCRQKCPRRRMIIRTRGRSPVIHLQTVAQVPHMRCIGNVCDIYCHMDSVPRCHLNKPSTVLVVGVVFRVVGASNEATVVIPVKVPIRCVHSIMAVASLNDKKTWVLLIDSIGKSLLPTRQYHKQLRARETNLS